MNEAVKDHLVSKLGTLVFANAELAGETMLLRKVVAHQGDKIKELQAKVDELLAAKAVTAPKPVETENLPANQYATPDAKVH
jgi:hypothetical protein